MRLFDYLKEQGLSNKQMRQALETGRVYIDDTPTADGGRDISKHHVTLRWQAPRVIVGRDPVVVFHDANVAVVAKPSGLLSVPAVNRRRDPSVISFVQHVLGGPSLPVHRLDEGTSGLMLVARSERMQFELKEELARRAIERQYFAIVRHTFGPASQVFDSVLIRNRGDGKRGSRPADAPVAEPEEGEASQGKRAITHVRLYEALARDASVVEAKLETGRTHQVRIHLAEAGFPILGDTLYGGSRHIAGASPRLALHAWLLAFRHPETGLPYEFQAPLPDDLEKLRRGLSQARQVRHSRRP